MVSPLNETYTQCVQRDCCNNDNPSLVLSSVSGGSSQQEDDIRECLHSTRSLLDLHEAENEGRDPSKPSQDMAQRLLAAKMHVQERGGFGRPVPVVETRSCFSSPGRPYLTLKEKLSKISRHDRRGGLNKAPSPLTHSNSILAEPTGRQPLSPASASTPSEGTFMRSKILSKGTPHGPRKLNSISLNIYDLIARDTLMQLPWGCMCEIGKCFNDVNTALHELGTGAYHVGVEVNGIEYAFGATNIPGKSGVFSCIPRLSPGYQYRTSVHFGERPLIRRTWVSVSEEKLGKSASDYKQVEEYVDGRQVIKQMVPDYMGADYDILRKNCCTFARDACLRLGIAEDEIPSWFGNLAESGALAQDVANATVEPLLTVLSSCEEGFDPEDELGRDSGFEVISKRNTAGNKEVVLVVPAKRLGPKTQLPGSSVRRTLTWAY